MKKLLLIALSLLTLTGCSSSASDSYSSSSSSSSGYSSSTESMTVTSSNLSESDISEKISYTVNMSIESKKFDDSIKTITSAMETYNGFIENSSISGKDSRSAYYVVRIPTEDYLSFIDDLENTGNVYNISVTAENLTTQFIDTTARLTSLELEEERLLELLEAADDVDTLIVIESRLSEVRYEIESYTTTLRALEMRVDYSTITIRLYEVIDYQKTDNFLNNIAATITNSFSGLVASLQNAILTVIYVLPFIIVWGAIFFVFWKIFKKPILKIKSKIKRKK